MIKIYKELHLNRTGRVFRELQCIHCGACLEVSELSGAGKAIDLVNFSPRSFWWITSLFVFSSVVWAIQGGVQGAVCLQRPGARLNHIPPVV